MRRGRFAAIHGQCDLSFDVDPFATFCSRQGLFRRFPQPRLQELDVSGIIKARFLQVNRARAGVGVGGGKHDLSLRQTEPAARPFAKRKDNVTVQSYEVAVNPEQFLATLGDIKRFGEQRVQHTDGGLNARGKTGEFDIGLRCDFDLGSA